MAMITHVPTSDKVTNHLVLFLPSFSSFPPPLPHTHSVKAMLLLIDCKDRIILQTSISSVLNGVEKGRKKLSNGVSSSTSSCV